MKFFSFLIFTVLLFVGCKEKISGDFLCDEHFIHIEGSQKEVTADIYSYNESALFEKPEMSFLLQKSGKSYEKETESGKKIIITINKDTAEFTKWSKSYSCKPLNRQKGKSSFDENSVIQFSKAHILDSFQQVLKSKNQTCGITQNKKEHLLRVINKSSFSIMENPKKEELFLFDRYTIEGNIQIPSEEVSGPELFTCALKKKYLFNTKCLKFVKRKTSTSNSSMSIPFTASLSTSKFSNLVKTESYFYISSLNGKEIESNIGKLFCDSIIPEIKVAEKVSESTVLK